MTMRIPQQARTDNRVEVPLRHFNDNDVSLPDLKTICLLCTKANERGFVDAYNMYEILKQFSPESLQVFLADAQDKMWLFPLGDTEEGLCVNFSDKEQVEKLYGTPVPNENEGEGPTRVNYPVWLFHDKSLDKKDHMIITACIVYEDPEVPGTTDAMMLAGLSRDFFFFSREDFSTCIDKLSAQQIITLDEANGRISLAV